MCAAALGVADVVGADVLIIADDRLALAHPGNTDVALAALVAVVARGATRAAVSAALCLDTAILRARVVVVAVYRLAYADAVATGVAACAGVTVVAGGDDRRVLAARERRTGVGRADVVIVTGGGRPGAAILAAGVADGARVAVVATAGRILDEAAFAR